MVIPCWCGLCPLCPLCLPRSNAVMMVEDVEENKRAQQSREQRSEYLTEQKAEVCRALVIRAPRLSAKLKSRRPTSFSFPTVPQVPLGTDEGLKRLHQTLPQSRTDVLSLGYGLSLRSSCTWSRAQWGLEMCVMAVIAVLAAGPPPPQCAQPQYLAQLRALCLARSSLETSTNALCTFTVPASNLPKAELASHLHALNKAATSCLMRRKEQVVPKAPLNKFVGSPRKPVTFRHVVSRF